MAEFHWIVQPDGRYWADDGGFGMENDVEIELCAKFNKEGIFVTPFARWRTILKRGICINSVVLIDSPYNTGNDFVYEDDFV